MSVTKSKQILDDDGTCCKLKGDLQFTYDGKFTTTNSNGAPVINYVKLVGVNSDVVFTFRWSLFLPVQDQWANNVAPWNDYRLLVIFVPDMPPIVRHGYENTVFDAMANLENSGWTGTRDGILKYISDEKAERAVLSDSDTTQNTPDTSSN